MRNSSDLTPGLKVQVGKDFPELFDFDAVSGAVGQLLDGVTRVYPQFKRMGALNDMKVTAVNEDDRSIGLAFEPRDAPALRRRQYCLHKASGSATHIKTSFANQP